MNISPVLSRLSSRLAGVTRCAETAQDSLRRGAHLLLRTRARTLGGTLRSTFERRFPGPARDNTDRAIEAEAA